LAAKPPLNRPGLVGQRDGFKILDLRVVAVAGADAVAPGAGVEGFGVGLCFPHVNAAGDAAFLAADELLAHKTRRFEKIRRDLGEVLAAFLEPDRWRQIVENNGGNHWGSQIGLPSRSSRTRPAFALWASARQPSLASRAKAGGRDRDRTCDPLDVNEVLSR
jgi:hypothetical protein